MRIELRATLVALVLCTLVLGMAYPLALTGVSQVAFSDAASGDLVSANGRVVGATLIGQDFKNVPRYFQSRPSATDYAANATGFSNAGPNSADLRDALVERAAAYLERERPYDPTLTRAGIPPDAVMTSASNVDPHISPQNAAIQARRVARVRGLPLRRVQALIDDTTAGRALGFLGSPAVNVLQLNLALDRETRS